MDGMCSTDQVVSDLRNKVRDAEIEVATAIAKLLPHIRVDHIAISYQFGTSANPNGCSVHTLFSYRIS